MKLKELLSNVVENKKNGQLNISLRRNKLKEVGISQDELLNLKLDPKLKKLLYED